MSTCRIFAHTLILAASLALVGACDGGGSAPAAPPPADTAPAPAPSRPAKKTVGPLTQAQSAAVERSFIAARKFADRAKELVKKGEEIEKTAGREAANDTLLEARRLYRKAAEMTEEWIEAELGPFSEEQIDKYMRSYMRERGKWLSASGRMGKLHD